MMSRALLLYTLFFISHNNFGIDERQYGILRALKDIEHSSNIKTWHLSEQWYNRYMILTKKKFTNSVEELVIQKQLTYIDAIVHFCQENHLEPDSVKGLVTPPLKEKIRAEAIGLRFLKGSKAKLPI